jgi:hypothetical protein
MAFKANPHENILFPVPYAENEDHALVITNQRIVQRSDAGQVELATREVGFVGRQTLRPRLPLGVMLLALALPLVGFGVYEIYSVWGMTAASPLSLVGVHGDDATQAPPPDGDDDATPVDWPRQVLLTRLLGLACLAAALGCAIGARRLVKKKRYFVMCRAERRLVKIEARDEIMQTQIMVTVSAVKGKK